MTRIKVSKKYQSFLKTEATLGDVDRYKQRMIISPKEERDAHNAALEAKKRAKLIAKLEAEHNVRLRTD